MFNLRNHKFVLIDRLLILAVALVLIIFCYDLYLVNLHIQKTLYSSGVDSTNSSFKKETMRPLSYYDDEISRRDVFKKIINESALLKPIATAPAFKELVKDLHILGIISGSQKQVIIEDSKSAKTYFLGVGDYLEEIKIDEINADNVVLEFKDEKIVLFL